MFFCSYLVLSFILCFEYRHFFLFLRLVLCKCLILQVRLCRRHSTICKHSHTVKQTNNRTHSKMMSSNDLSGIFHVFYIMYEPFLILILYLVFLPFSSHPFHRLKRIRPIFIRWFSFFRSLVIVSDLANEEDEAFSDAVSQIKPTTVTSSHL